VVSESEAVGEASEVFSDVSDTTEVLEMRLVAGVRFFQLKLAHEIKWLSNEDMRRRYPRELIAYYEKFITIT
jgi:hypothetical protein